MKKKLRAYGTAVTLKVAPTDPAGTWNTLAYAVDLKGRGVKLTKEIFEQCVKNFARYPKVPVVIEHADTEFGAPAEWAEPKGHITELRLGTFQRPGGAEVDALDGRTLLEPAIRPAVLGGKNEAGEDVPPKWAFGSVTIFFKVKDEETGEELGAMLWSFSLTAHNALADLPKLAASRGGAGVQTGYYWGELDDRADLVQALRCIFELPALAPEADVLAALDRFEQLATGPADAAQGVDLDHVLCALREALRLPVLSTVTEVIAAVRAGLASLPVESTGETMSRGTAPQTNPTEKSMKTFLMLAAAFALSAKTEEEAQREVEALAQQGHDARRALNTTTSAETAKALVSLQTKATKADELEKELVTLRTDRDKRDAAERAAYVADVMRAESIPDVARKSLELHAKTDWEGFQKDHPLTSEERVELRASERAELAQRQQDGERLGRTPKPRGKAPTPRPETADGPTAEELLAGAQLLVEREAALGRSISLSEAFSMMEQGASAQLEEPDDSDEDASGA